MAKTNNNVDKLSFEEAIKELAAIVEKIEEGEITLNDSLEQYEKGMKLIHRCRAILTEAERRIEKISSGEQGGDDGGAEKSGQLPF